MISKENPKEKYQFKADNFRLTNLHIVSSYETLAERTQKDSAGDEWEVSCPRMKYVFTQTVSTWFTDTDSYKDTERAPPTTYTGLLNYAASVSKVSLPQLMSGAGNMSSAVASVSDWIVTEHNMVMEPEGVYRVDIVMMAYSNYIWNRSAFRKHKIPRASDIANESPYI